MLGGGFCSENGGRRGPVVAHVAAARVRRHAHLLPLRLPLRVRAIHFSFLLLVVVVFPTHGVERVRVIGWFGAGS